MRLDVGENTVHIPLYHGLMSPGHQVLGQAKSLPFDLNLLSVPDLQFASWLLMPEKLQLP